MGCIWQGRELEKKLTVGAYRLYIHRQHCNIDVLFFVSSREICGDTVHMYQKQKSRKTQRVAIVIWE